MQWERRQDAEGGRVVAMWLLIQDGGIIAELTVEHQRYRGFPDSFVVFLKDTGWVYEDKWNVSGHTNGYKPVSDVDPPWGRLCSRSYSRQYQFDEFVSAIDRAREEISGSDATPPVAVGTNADKLTHTGGEQASYVWRISPDEQLNRNAGEMLTDDPAEWNNITPFDSPHTSMPDAMKETIGVLEDSDHPVDGGPS